ncbi:MAG: hypothetical protein QOK23_4597 [Gammaproteobacteria bacterium]|jgi:hypothetical protein|nr:hypothetical protein [Gammaproteobacteria bacterium]
MQEFCIWHVSQIKAIYDRLSAPLARATRQATGGPPTDRAKQTHHAARAGDPRLALCRVSRFNTRMSDSRIDFSAPATRRKWQSVNKERVSASLGARPYMIGEGGTLDECIQHLCVSPKRNVICTKFTPRRSLILSAPFCPGTTSLSWRDSGIFTENSDPAQSNLAPQIT